MEGWTQVETIRLRVCLLKYFGDTVDDCPFDEIHQRHSHDADDTES
jgi:hypothetical protein